MRLIKPSFEILEQEPGIQGIYKQIERAGRTCYSEDTEVLTFSGWKYFKDVSKYECVLTYNPKTNKLEWDLPNIFSKTIDDEMIEIDHPNIKLKVTKDHRIYQSPSTSKKYSFITAAQLAGIEKIPNSKQSRFRIPKYFNGATKSEHATPESYTYSKYIKQGGNPKHKDKLVTVQIPCNKDFMVIAGAYISEGHSEHREKYKCGSYCQITQDEVSPLYKNVIQALNNLQWKYTISCDPRKPNIKWIQFGRGQCFVECFDKLFGKGSANKHLPENFRNFPKEYLEILVKNLYLGDGSHSITRKERYLSISKQLLDELQQVFILLGKNASYTFDANISQKCSLEESSRDSWIIDRKKHVKILPKCQQTVWCTQTKTGIICVRYKGKVCWCGNCYKSEDRITEDSAEKFVNMIKDRQHTAMLEHGTVYLYIHKDHAYNVIGDNWVTEQYLSNSYSVINTDSYGNYHITTNYRVLYENDWLDDLKYLCEPTEYHEKRITIKFICDRGVSHEFVRHRVFSFAQESTRYCNYSKNKFGNELTFIIPYWTNIPEGQSYWHDGIGYRVGADIQNKDFGYIEKSSNYFNFLSSLEESEKCYLRLLNEGWVPQQARSILPNSLKTELVMTGTVEQWRGFFKLRTDKAAHPQAQELAIPLKEEFKQLHYIND